MITLLTYDAPHYKTERFLLDLAAHGLKPDRVVGAPLKTLDLPPAMRLSVKHAARHPRSLCAQVGVRYEVQPHEEMDGDELGVVGGARILPGRVLSRFDVGVLNLHPGAIPSNRGLSNLARAVAKGLPPTVTAHIVDARVDAGRCLFSRSVGVELDDTPEDLSERILDTQVQMLVPAVRMALTYRGVDPLPDIGKAPPPLHANDERAIMRELWADYRSTMAARGAP